MDALEKNIDLNIQNRVLIWASYNGHTEIVEKLLEKNPDSNVQNTALIWASCNGHTEIVKKLLEKNAKPDIQDSKGNTALIWASQNGHTEIVEKLLEKNAKPDIQDSKGNTALMLASYNGHIEIVKKLLQQEDIDLKIKNKHEDTVLIFALRKKDCLKEREQIALILLDKMDLSLVDAQNRHNSTALTLASQKGLTDLVKKLIKRGVDVRKKDNDGDTSVIMSAEFGHIEILRTLLESGAEPNIDIQDNSGNITPRKIKNLEIKELLETYKVASNIFSESQDIETLIKDINSFKKEDLMEVKSFSFQNKELKLNAIGIINLYEFHKSNSMEVDSRLEEAINSLDKKIKNIHEAPSTSTRINKEVGPFVEEEAVANERKKRSAKDANLGEGGRYIIA